MNKSPLFLKRQRAEKRFKWYGRIAIGFALLSLGVLLVTIIERGWQGFLHTEIALTLYIEPDTIGSDPELWKHSDVSPYIKQALVKELGTPEDYRTMRELTGLISSGATLVIRHKLMEDPSQLGKTITLWLPASDALDRAVKSHFTKDTPEIERKITDKQLAWLDELRKKDAVWLTWNPYFFSSGDSREPELAGFAGSMAGSFFVLLSCMLLAVPIGVMAAIYLEEFARKNSITEWIEISINNLAAVPSIVFGLLGLAVYLNLFGIPRSASIAGGLTLALMVLPTIIIATRAALRAIPDTIRDAARGLGASPLQVVLHHTFPLAIPGIMTGTILGLARAMGETAPLLMIGMVAFIADIPRNPLDPATAMPVQIFLWATSPEIGFVEKTAAGILVLISVLIALNSIAIFIRKRFEHRW